MKPVRVYLVRHGEAEGSSPGGDAGRRLTSEGRSLCAALAGELAPRLELSRVVTSPLVRARETAEILASATGARVEENAALASGQSSPRELIELALQTGEGTALVGHNPEIAGAIALVAGGERKIRPGTIAAIDIDEDGPRVTWLEYPRGD